MKLKIKVTKEILERSKLCGTLIGQDTGTNCAIALAVRDIFPKAWVEDDKIQPFYGEELQKTNFATKIELPDHAIDFIKEFDSSTPEQRVEMDPIEFEVYVPDDVLDQISIEEITKIVEESPTLELVP